MSDDAYAVVINGRTYVEMYAAQKLVQEARRQTRDKVLEEAARTFDGRRGFMDYEEIAAAIRALKEKSDE